ncbi:MAG: aminopeptidase P family protein [Hyphomicrobiales bacterium]|nr:MAG: aminopeptidase P family protein [Hyphomicrobiales bacterium]
MEHLTFPRASQSVFAQSEFEHRQAAARRRMADAGIDVMVVTGPENIFYLCGQQTPGYYTFQALILPQEGEPVFVVRELEYANLLANTHLQDAVRYSDGESPVDKIVAIFIQHGWSGLRVGVEKGGWFLTVSLYERLSATLSSVHDATGIVEWLRAVKSPAELRNIEAAARYTEAGMRAGMAAVRAGASENDVVAAMVQASIAAGSEYVGMMPLVAAGAASGVPHSTWRRRTIGPSDAVFLEMASCHDRYHAVLMRTAWIGPPPALATAMMDACQAGLAAALSQVRPGATCEQAHRACKAEIARAGFGDSYTKRSGYSVGIAFAPDWGEWQVLSVFDGATRPIEAGMVLHLTPALRHMGVFTVGVSETVIVTEDGCRVLSGLSRALAVR